MSCQILIGNRAGDKGEIIVIGSSTHVWTHNETFKSWILKFPEKEPSEYHRNFTLVIVSDKDPEQLDYLGEVLQLDGAPLGLRWSFIEPDTSTDLWQELLITGEVTLPWSVVSMYLKENT